MGRRKDDGMGYLDEEISGVSTYDLFLIHKYMEDNDLKRKRKLDQKNRKETRRNEGRD